MLLLLLQLERNNPRVFNRLDQQTTSGDSDSNASDAAYGHSAGVSPSVSVQQRAQLFQQRATPNGTQFRSVSSVQQQQQQMASAGGKNVAIARRTPNYLARMSQQEQQGEDANGGTSGQPLDERNPIAELNDVNDISASAKSGFAFFASV